MGLREAVRARSSVARFPQARKPLVEKKRRARINESLQELRRLLAGTEVRREGCRGRLQSTRQSSRGDSIPFPSAQVQAKLENAEVLELTVRRVQGALRGRARGEWLRGPEGWGSDRTCLPLMEQTRRLPKSGAWSKARAPPSPSRTLQCFSWVSPESAERIVGVIVVPAHGGGRCFLLPTLLHRAGAAAGGSKRALRCWLHPMHA